MSKTVKKMLGSGLIVYRDRVHSLLGEAYELDIDTTGETSEGERMASYLIKEYPLLKVVNIYGATFYLQHPQHWQAATLKALHRDILAYSTYGECPRFEEDGDAG